ncbi:MAG TPA: DUF1801 domain-containing protein [Verrucomicrobiae bacterium]|nr:DUF1801 domain-containing protein [Verrucomicrobiae bacterium]
MKTKRAKPAAVAAPKSRPGDAISAYESGQTPEHAAICQALRKEIDAVLKKATSKVWHAMPVWFMGENPVVGYKASAKNVNLLFWNGQAFAEPALKAAGKFRAAQIQFTSVTEIDRAALRRWLKKAATDVWDYKGMREGNLAKRVK